MYYIDLQGPGGNAFALMGTAKKLGKALGYDHQQIDKMLQEMMSGDYENLKKVFMKNFSEVAEFEEEEEYE
jgi:hypothetical protein